MKAVFSVSPRRDMTRTEWKYLHRCMRVMVRDFTFTRCVDTANAEFRDLMLYGKSFRRVEKP